MGSENLTPYPALPHYHPDANRFKLKSGTGIIPPNPTISRDFLVFIHPTILNKVSNLGSSCLIQNLPY
ncbi:hypothetical protein AYI69_g6029 [Smittium culicis]|uniref:Uncharacterized protein n=1 Tax=Smittium culicis TaxID=133412 RepID=A0A1R1Y207_9FUNG|nr:hypothetical protein AYI69_g6029 [Smittium culicis]